MTMKDVLQHFGFNEWANARTFGAIETLTPEEMTKNLGASFPTILGTAAHMAGAEWIWLRRWKGENPMAMPEWVSARAILDVRARLAAVEVERAVWLATLTDADLDRRVTFTAFNGKTHSQAFDPMFMHVVNHSTYHRGQIAAMMRQVGATPVGTDLIAYARESGR